MEKLMISTIIVIVVLLLSVYVAYADHVEPDDYWLIPDLRNDSIPRYVPVFYTNEIFFCEQLAIESKGCYVKLPNFEYIMIVQELEFDWANQGCTVHDHEYFHAMGWKHGVGPLSTTCDNPFSFTKNNINMAYDEDNPKHKDLTKDYKVVFPFDSSVNVRAPYQGEGQQFWDIQQSWPVLVRG